MGHMSKKLSSAPVRGVFPLRNNTDCLLLARTADIRLCDACVCHGSRQQSMMRLLLRCSSSSTSSSPTTCSCL